jgi:hypothetical protein
MKYAGLLVMPAGFFLCVAALFCGLAVEALGLVVAVRGHIEPRGDAN